MGDAIPISSPSASRDGRPRRHFMPPTRSILLVEEDAVCRGFLADNLTADGYEVILAADKADAIAKLSVGPDLVLCDVNGHTLELLDAVRSGAGLAARI